MALHAVIVANTRRYIGSDRAVITASIREALVVSAPVRGAKLVAVAISALRKLKGMSQEKLAEKAGISRSLVSTIEAPGIANGFSLEVFYNIADALEIDPADLINASVFHDKIIHQNKK